MLAGAGMALSLMFAAACDDDDPVEPPVPTALNITSGDNQTIAVSTESAPLTVTLLDQNDEPLQGRTVTWTIVTGTGTLESATSVTDAQGVATMTFTSGIAAGAVTVSATVTGLTPVTFDIMVQ
jgi:adhesin/invasin